MLIDIGFTLGAVLEPLLVAAGPPFSVSSIEILTAVVVAVLDTPRATRMMINENTIPYIDQSGPRRRLSTHNHLCNLYEARIK